MVRLLLAWLTTLLYTRSDSVWAVRAPVATSRSRASLVSLRLALVLRWLAVVAVGVGPSLPTSFVLRLYWPSSVVGLLVSLFSVQEVAQLLEAVLVRRLFTGVQLPTLVVSTRTSQLRVVTLLATFDWFNLYP